jgi:solute carrier family 25 folate transporter 32
MIQIIYGMQFMIRLMHAQVYKILLMDAQQSLIQAAAGAFSGLASALIVNPLDVVKIRVQNSYKRSSMDCCREIWITEGSRGFVRGMATTAIAYSLDKAIWFSSYVKIKRILATVLDIPSQSFINQFYSSVISSAITILSTNPLWMIRTRLMTQPLSVTKNSYYYSSILNAISTIYRNEGFTAFYKGLGPSFLGISHVAIQFPLYEQIKIYLKKDKGSDDLEKSSILMASSLSKIIASLITYPHEVVRTRLQTQIGNAADAKYQSLVQSIRMIYKEEGMSSFYKGIGINFIRTVPTTAFSLLTYEMLVVKLEKALL